MTSIPNSSREVGFESLNRQALMNSLGLGRFTYTFFDASDDLIVRAVRVIGSDVQVLLEPWSLDPGLSASGGSPASPVAAFRRSGYRLGVLSPDEERPLAAQIFPYPFNQMASQSPSESLEASPKGLLWALRRFEAAMAGAERKLASREIGCLYIDGRNESFTLLTQHVGRKRVRVGQLSAEAAFSLKEVPFEEAIQKIGEAIGAQVCGLRITLEQQENLIGQLDHVTLALQAGLGEMAEPPSLPERPPDLTL